MLLHSMKAGASNQTAKVMYKATNVGKVPLSNRAKYEFELI